VTLADLLKAYARVTTRAEYRPLALDQREVYAVEAALQRLRAVIGTSADWAKLAAFLPEGWRGQDGRRRSAVASTFSAMLELAKLGEIEIRQEAVFAPIFLRRRASPAEGGAPA
jgi:segregation and condensation protein A